MKKLSVLLLVILVLSISACKKFFDISGGQPVGLSHKVSFRFSGLNHNVGEANLGMQTEPLKNYGNNIANYPSLYNLCLFAV